ncbi:MAG TPA: hypothetical protein VIW80_19545 [Pyrinomonadaceae bacterium]|jgi:hypothetical protein
MADFGTAGKRTVRVFKAAAIVRFKQGEHLHFRLTVQGAEPIFTFGCADRSLLSEHEFAGHPKKVYEWDWGLAAGDIDNADDMYGVAMIFLTAVKYTLLLEHRNKDSKLIKVLKDIDYESQAPEDNFTEIIEILAE